MKSKNWFEPNQTHYTLIELQTKYKTQDVADMLDGLQLDGYTGLSLGLIIDLIKQRCPEVGTTPSSCCNAATAEVNLARTVGRTECYNECQMCGLIS